MMITNSEKAIQTIQNHKGEFAEVKNPSYIYPPVEYYPLAKRSKKVSSLMGAMMDMDGTTTTTEVLCIYALEMMIRRMSGKMNKEQWKGIDHNTDLAFIIGNSTTKHVEYLIKTYRNLLDEKQSVKEFIRAARWTLQNSPDKNRRQEVMTNIRKLGLSEYLPAFENETEISLLSHGWIKDISANTFEMLVNMGIDMYYQTYHEILIMLRDGKGEVVRNMVFEKNHHDDLISPMPGIPFLIPLLKGWLGDEAPVMKDILFTDYERSTGSSLTKEKKEYLTKKIEKMGLQFQKNPVKVALVTSSIFYEADIIIKEIFKIMSDIIEKSDLSNGKKAIIRNKYTHYHNVYDSFVTANDSSEIRLKPHRDLYSIALHKAALLPGDFDKVIGFEDSESGTIAMRAAGIGCCIAVPFAETSGHNLQAASHILSGGVPSAILDHDLFMQFP